MAIFQVNGTAPLSDTLPHHLLWAQTFGGAFTTFGWVAQTGHGEVPATGTGVSYAWTTPGPVPTVKLTGGQTTRFNGAWVSGTSYTGANTTNSATVSDLVTSAGITYVCILSTSGVTAPASDTAHWQPYIYEIWKSNGAQSSTNPLYIRIVYTVDPTGSPAAPSIIYAIGSGIDSNGNVTGTFGNATSGFNNAILNTTAGIGTTAPMCFSGDSDNFRCITWQGLVSAPTNGGWNWMFIVDRVKNGSGADSDAFTYCGVISPVQNGGPGQMFHATAIVFKPAISPTLSLGGTWRGLVWQGVNTATLATFGATPALPIFPLVGYIANPLLGIVGFQNIDVKDGQLVPVWIYGASHNFLVNSIQATNATYSGRNTLLYDGTSDTRMGNTIVPAIRYE